jgi:Fe2+ or Zn2+ uptake regulation protein
MPNKKIDHALEDILKCGFRKSALREMILASIASSDRPISAADIIGMLAKKGNACNKTTVYRELETLKKTGKIKEVFLRNDRALYELVGSHHHHIVCISCGDIRHIDVHEPAEWPCAGSIRKQGFKIIDHSLEFFGVCGQCR